MLVENIMAFVSSLSPGDTFIIPEQPGKTWVVLDGGSPAYSIPEGRSVATLEGGFLTYASASQQYIPVNLKAVSA